MVPGVLSHGLRLVSNASRHFAARHNGWDGITHKFRFFVSAHRPHSDQDEHFRVRVGGLRLIIRPADWCAFDEVLLRDEYRIVEEILAGCRKPRVLDLGANVGLFSARVFACSPNAGVISIEASRSAFRVLRQNCRANPMCAWSARNCAVWKEDGLVGFSESRWSTASRVSPGSMKKVPATTLARLLAQVSEPVDLVKMDIEGAEESVLSAARAALDAVRCLIVEIHPDLCDGRAVISVLRDRFPFLYQVPQRYSAKPLVVAARVSCSLPAFGKEAA